MQRRWILAVIVGSGLAAQTPLPPPAPELVQAPEPVRPLPQVEPPVTAPKAEEPGAPQAFDQLRPSQRKFAYSLHRTALAAHELGYYRSHPKAVEVRDALQALVDAQAGLPEKARGGVPAAEAYLAQLRANHGLYGADGKKLLLDGNWKALQASARAAAKAGAPGLEGRLLKVKGLLTDPKVDATAPSWAEPAPARKGRKAKPVRVPEGFAEQKAVLTLWLRRAQAWVGNVPQEADVNGERKSRRAADPAPTKALGDLLAWLGKDDLDLLRDPGFAWFDLRYLGAEPGKELLAHAPDIVAGKGPEGAPGELALLPALEPVMGESRFGAGEEKRPVLAEVKQGAPASSLAAQMAAFEKAGRSREIEVK